MADTALHHMTINSLAESIREGKLSPVELTEHCLSRIESLDKTLNAFRVVCRKNALKAAKAAERDFQEGQESGLLRGIPYAAKDLFDVKGLPTSAGARLLGKKEAEQDATVIRRLTQEGMTLLGKTNTVQFAFSGLGINHDHGTPHNPWKETHYLPGGSSSGSAVAVASGMTPLALGTDTGGSVRVPAALCGITGLKTTVGRISRFGVYPLSWTLDSVGLLARSVDDAALVYQCIQGYDSKDEATWNRPSQDVFKGFNDGVKGLRIAFPDLVFWEDVHPEVEQAVRKCGEILESLGALLGPIPFLEVEEAQRLNASGLIVAAEGYAINRQLLENHPDELDPVVSRRMVKAGNIHAADYLKDKQDLKNLWEKVNHALNDIDALLVPTTMIPSTPVAESEYDWKTYTKYNWAYLRNTAIGNMLNLCGLTVPCGFTADGLPIGLMIYGKPYQEDMILRIGHAFQQATDWHKKTPNLDWVE